MRRFRCRECGQEREAPSRTGALPSVCDVCDPEAAVRRAQRRAQPPVSVRLHARIRELEAEVELLRAQIGADDALRRRVKGEPSREAVQIAVRRVAWAEGRAAMREALLNLAAEARAWAVKLADSDAEAAQS